MSPRRPLKPARQLGSAKRSGRRVFNFWRIHSITLLSSGANNASRPSACTPLNGRLVERGRLHDTPFRALVGHHLDERDLGRGQAAVGEELREGLLRGGAVHPRFCGAVCKLLKLGHLPVLLHAVSHPLPRFSSVDPLLTGLPCSVLACSLWSCGPGGACLSLLPVDRPLVCGDARAPFRRQCHCWALSA